MQRQFWTAFKNDCITALNSKEARDNIKLLLSPVTDFILSETQLYLYIIILLVTLMFSLLIIILLYLVNISNRLTPILTNK